MPTTEELKKPLRTWLGDLHAKKKDKMLLCQGGQEMVANRYKDAHDAWLNCSHTCYLVKSLVASDICVGEDYVRLCIKLLDGLLIEHGDHPKDVLTDPRVFELYEKFKYERYEFNESARHEFTRYHNVLQDIYDLRDYGKLRHVALVLCAMCRLFMYDFYEINNLTDCMMSYGGTSAKNASRLNKMLRNLYDNPFLLKEDANEATLSSA